MTSIKPYMKLYKNVIIYKLLKNDVTLYGSFIRMVLFEKQTFKEALQKINIIYGYSKLIYKNIIERDLNKYIINTDKLSSGNIDMYDSVVYLIKYFDITFSLEISYLKSSLSSTLSYYLSDYIPELSVILDIDCISIDRLSINFLKLNNLYKNDPCPLFKIIHNIKGHRFKILPKIKFNEGTIKYIDNLKYLGWTNTDNKLIYFDTIHSDQITEILSDTCGICNEQHDKHSIGLPCFHFFHHACFTGFINNYLQEVHYNLSVKVLTCPYCTKELNIRNII